MNSKKIIGAIGIGCFLISCAGNEGANKADIEQGLALIGNSDCLTCHRPDEVLTGPSYSSIADKYAGLSDTMVSHLASKIVKGGTGVWGQVPMVPHSGISQSDAELMVKYILSLKK